MKVRFKRFSTRARVSQKLTTGSTCYDLFAARCVALEPGATRSRETFIGFCFSNKYVAKIYSRSSVSLTSDFLGGGLVDSNYRGNVRVIVHNLSKNRVDFNTGDRIAQVLSQKKIFQVLLNSSKFIKVANFNNYIKIEILKDLGQLAFKNGSK